MSLFINPDKNVQIQIGFTQMGASPKFMCTPVYLPLEGCNYVDVALFEDKEEAAFELTTSQGKAGYISAKVFLQLLRKKELILSFQEEVEFIFPEDLTTKIQTGTYGAGWNAGVIIEEVTIPAGSVFTVTEMNSWPENDFRGKMDSPNGNKTVQDISYFDSIFFLKLILDGIVVPKQPIKEDKTRVVFTKDYTTECNTGGGWNPRYENITHFKQGEIVEVHEDCVRDKDRRVFKVEDLIAAGFVRYVLQ